MSEKKYIDSHCHVDLIAGKLATAIRPWRKFLEKHPMPPEYAGVIAIFCFSDEKSWGKWDAYLSEEDHVWGAVGIHPHQAVQFEAGVRSLIIEAMKHPRVVAWGECGLVSFHCFPLYLLDLE